MPTSAALPALSSGRLPALNGGTASALVLFSGLLSLFGLKADGLLADPDTHWHIAVGARIWESGTFPAVDEFSHTHRGHPWIAKEWLSQLILFAAYAVGGWTGVVLTAALTIAGTFAALYHWLRARVRWTAAIILVSLTLILALAHFLARPHALTYPVLVLWTAGLVGAAERRSAPPWWLIPLMALWANLHGGYTLGFMVAAFLGAEAILGAPSADRIRLAGRWALVGASCALAACATPYGAETLVITLTMFGSGEALAYINEWRPLQADVQGAFAVGSLGLALAALSPQPRRNAFRILLVAVCGYMMIRYVRFTGPFAVIAAMAVAHPLVRRFPGLAPLPTGGGLRALLLAALLAAVTMGAFVRTPPSPSPLTTPEAALKAADALGLTGPVFNSYDFGGYLIARGVPTFIDGRTDQLFVNGFFNAYSQARQSDDGALIRLAERYGVTWALVQTGSPEAARFAEAAGWRAVHRDPVAEVFARDRSGSD